MLDGVDYSSTSEYFGDLDNLPKTTTTRRKSKNIKRRFSDDQIRSLEVTFESETKLEPRKKAQLASELGLQPRQVAIWFQNKRARWKSKQIEKDYGSLLASYNSLASQFESLKKENQTLLVQLQELRNEMEGNPESKNRNFEIQEPAGNSSSTTDGESDYTRIDFEAKTNNNISSMLSDEDDSSMKAEFLAPLENEDDNGLLKMVETGADSSLTSADDWGSLDSGDFINQPTDQTYQWWDFWA